MPFSSQQRPPQSDSWRKTECMSALIANVLPAPVSPVMSQPRQKSLRSQVNPAREAVVLGLFDFGGAKHQPRGTLTNRGRKLTQPTIGWKNQPRARQIIQRKRRGKEQMYSSFARCRNRRIQSTAAADAWVR